MSMWHGSCRHLDGPDESALKGSDEEEARNAPEASKTAAVVSSPAQETETAGDDGNRDG